MHSPQEMLHCHWIYGVVRKSRIKKTIQIPMSKYPRLAKQQRIEF